MLSANGAAAMEGRHDDLLCSVGGAAAAKVPSSLSLVAHNVAVGAAPGLVTFDFHPLASGWSSMTAGFVPDLLVKMRADLELIFRSLPLGTLLPSWLWRWFIEGLLRKAAQATPVKARVTTLSAFLEEQRIQTVDLLKVRNGPGEEKIAFLHDAHTACPASWYAVHAAHTHARTHAHSLPLRLTLRELRWM